MWYASDMSFSELRLRAHADAHEKDGRSDGVGLIGDELTDGAPASVERRRRRL